MPADLQLAGFAAETRHIPLEFSVSNRTSLVEKTLGAREWAAPGATISSKATRAIFLRNTCSFSNCTSKENVRC